MGNKVFVNLIESEIKKFNSAFAEDSYNLFYDESKKQLIHAGEYGTYREIVCKQFLRYFIPGNLAISSGFIMTPKNEISTQCDIIIYDPYNTPLIQTDERQKFFPVETLAAVGEIKSSMSKAGLIDALKKLSATKKLRESMVQPCTTIKKKIPGNYDPNVCYDQLFTFLICKNLNFNINDLPNVIIEAYNSISIQYRHNLILSLDDGVFFYGNGDKTFCWPTFKSKDGKQTVPSYWDKDEKDSYLHYKIFAQQLFMGMTDASIFYPEMINYLNI